MPRTLLTFAATAALALVLPAAADASRPSPGSFYDGNPEHGLYLENTRKKITTLWLFCTRPEYTERQNRYVPRGRIKIRRSGRFEFRGVANRYGPEGQWLGHFDVRLKGRFVGDGRVKVKRRLSGCDTRTAGAARES
jgi:hypothetical protein